MHIDTYPRKNWKKGGRKAAIDLPTHTEIEEEVHRVLQEQVPEIVGVTRVMSHYEEGASLLSFSFLIICALSLIAARLLFCPLYPTVRLSSTLTLVVHHQPRRIIS